MVQETQTMEQKKSSFPDQELYSQMPSQISLLKLERNIFIMKACVTNYFPPSYLYLKTPTE